jgi:hypothetical protein
VLARDFMMEMESEYQQPMVVVATSDMVLAGAPRGKTARRQQNAITSLENRLPLDRICTLFICIH